MDRERGGVAVTVVGFFVGSSVIMGMLAISIDLGNLTYERRQVQNGADATSLALASECAADAANCNPTQVRDLLGANSHDAAGRYDTSEYTPGACARGNLDQVGPLDGVECVTAGDINDLGECPPLPDWLATEPGIPYVETYAATETADGGTELFMPFSRYLLGGASGDKGTSACARAAWGQPVSYSGTLPLTFSSCEWDEQTSGGTDFVENGPIGPKPGYGPSNPWPDASKEIVLWLKTPSEDTHCDWNGQDTAGGFGWLDDTGDCEAEVSTDDWVEIDPGVNVPQACQDLLATLNNTVIDVPIFDCIVGDAALAVGEPPTDPDACNPDNKSGGGANTWYHLAGWAKFYISGFVLPGNQETASSLGSDCGNGDKCITGWFLTGALADVAEIGPPGGSDDFGTYAVKPAG